jgi:hypothetical protein
MAGRNIKIVFTALDKTATGIRKVTQSVTRVGMKLAKVTAGFAAAGAAASAAIVRSQLPVIDALGKTSDRLGLTTQAMGGLQHAADLAGVSQSTLAMSLQRFNRRVSEAADFSGEAVAALHELGLDAEILEQIPLDQAMMKVADAFGHVGSSGDKTRLAMKLFDSEGVALLTMLENQSAGLRDAAREADKLGLTLSRMEVAQVEIANDSLTRLGSATEALKNKFTIALAPAIEQVANFMRQLTLDALGFGDVSQIIDKVIKGVWGGLLDLFHGLKVASKFIQIGFLEIYQVTRDKLVVAFDFLIERFNAINSALPDWMKMDPINNPVSKFAKSAHKDILLLNDELKTLLNEGLPSEKFAAAYDTIIKKHRELAEEIAKNKPGGAGGQNDPEVKKMRFRERLMKEGALKEKEFQKKHRSEQAVEVLGHMSKMFAKSKAFQVAQALMDTYRGATLSLSSYPFPINIAMMTATIAAGMQQVQAIRSQSFMGGGFTGGGPRSGGVDGQGGFPAILHPNESVIDHKGGSMGGVTVINNIDAKNADTFTEMRIRQAIDESSQATIGRIINLQRRGRLA